MLMAIAVNAFSAKLTCRQTCLLDTLRIMRVVKELDGIYVGNVNIIQHQLLFQKKRFRTN